MQECKTDARYAEGVGQLSDRLRGLLMKVPTEITWTIQEIRLGIGRPIMVWTGQEILFVNQSGNLLRTPDQHCPVINRDDIQRSVEALCRYSIHSHQQEMQEGFITAMGGHRAGLAGTGVYHGGKLSAVRDICGINLRISRQIKGCSENMLRHVFANGICSFILAGPPSTGKTTLLRDTAWQISSGRLGRIYKTAVIDERGEIAACFQGIPQNDMGYCCDVLNNYAKAEGILQAVRTLSPHIILCDEIGTAEEMEAVTQSLNSGVSVITTLHAGSWEEFITKPQGKGLMATGAFKHLVLLKEGQPGKIKEMINLDRQVEECSKRQVVY